MADAAAAKPDAPAGDAPADGRPGPSASGTGPFPPAPACADVPPPPLRGWFPLLPGRPYGVVKVLPQSLDPRLVFAVTHDGRLWRSEDGGQRFCVANTPLPVNDVYPAPGTAAVVYARASSRPALLRSSDGGRTWEERVWPERGARLAIAPGEPDVLYLTLVATPTAPVVRSVDGGRTWTILGPPLPEGAELWSLRGDPGRRDVLHASGPCDERSICWWRRSEAAGRWELMSRESRAAGVPDLTFVTDRASRLFRLALTRPSTPEPQVLLRSLDDGATWTRLPPLPDGQSLIALATDDLPPGHLFALAAGETPATSSVLESADGGETWKAVARGPFSASPHGEDRYADNALSVASGAGRSLFIRAGTAVMRLDEEATALHLISVDLGVVDRLEVAPSAPQVVYIVDRGRLYRSGDGGERWEQRPTPDYQAMAFAVDPRDPDRLWGWFALSLGNGRRGLYRSSDGGRRWEQIPPALLPASSLDRLIIPRRAPDTIYATSLLRGVVVSVDRGASWRLVPVADGAGATNLAVAESDPRIAYVIEGREGSILVTRDGFATLSPTTPPPRRETFAELMVDPHDPQVVLVQGHDFRHRTLDGGKTWTAFPRGFPATGKVRFHPAVPGTLFAFGVEPLRVSEDGGRTWTSATLGLPAMGGVGALGFDLLAPSTLLAAAGWSGLWKTVTGGH